MDLPSEPLLLSILIPAYQYAEGVSRILENLPRLRPENCEIIVFDDSLDDDVEKVVAHWCRSTSMQLVYQRNRPAKGAAANWNALLDVARGEFCLLLHHDEFPLGARFFVDLVTALQQVPEMDVLLLDCVLVAPSIGRNRRHLPTWLRALVIRWFPYYLFRRNVIGPTSSIVVRRTLYPRFDTRLRWLVDVDAYVRLLKATRRLKLCPQIRIGSIMSRSDSITAQLGSAIPQLEREERAYLREVHPEVGLWLGPTSNEAAWNWLIRACETACWALMRVCTRIPALFCFGTVPRMVVQRALHPPRTMSSSSAPIP